MRTSSLFFAGIAVTLVSIAPANAQKEAPVKRETPVSRHAKVQAPMLIYCRRDIPCRPVRKGCHLEQEQFNGWNNEVCN
ncbi:MAG TPA: hypothetical protein VMU69_24455 [Bradyrhizobium sp.]|nr:hypothetical protein [Bradyrhizobium sp.]